MPYTSATVTKLQNRVSYGEARAGSTRKAQIADIVRAENYLLTETDSRAELQYQDGSLVRIGQNTVFSFDASSRTLELEKGTFIFFVPKNSGGGVIKTPSLTAAITGTAGKVSRNIIAIIEGEVKLVPSGRFVRAGEFARRNPDGTITIARFNPAQVREGELVTFNGIMPGFDEERIEVESELPQINLRTFEVLHRTQNLPSAINHFFPPTPEPPPPADRRDPRVSVPPPQNQPPTPG
ncbi:MAG: hypothetical protein EOP84_11970, partial [Verrucomicrobiaceae bacterium]